MRTHTRLAVLALLAALAAGVASIGSATATRATTAGFPLVHASSGATQGLVFLRQSGQQLTGWIAVSGFPVPQRVADASPGLPTTRALHVHRGSCAQPGPTVLDLGEVDTGMSGAAVVEVKTRSAASLLRRGYYVDVHATSSGAASAVLCGDVVPVG